VEQDKIEDRKTEAPKWPASFQVFQREPVKTETSWNRALKKFNVVEALDLVLKSKNAAEIVGMIDELDRLGKLDAALSGRDSQNLANLLEFLTVNVVDPVWSHVILKAVVAVEKIYRVVIVDDPVVGGVFEELVRVINEELETQAKAARLVGQIDVLLDHHWT
jgi:hypothetical protein